MSKKLKALRAERKADIAEEKRRLLAGYPAAWAEMVRQWRADGPGDTCWLQYVANYLFRTGGARWAMDLAFMPALFTDDDLSDLAGDLAGLSFVVLTHRHGDHFCRRTLRALEALPIQWVVPEHLVDAVIEAGGIPRGNITVPRLMERFEIDGIGITAFGGMHWEWWESDGGESARIGVPSAGYLVETGERRLLFPGDVRSYDADMLPPFGPVDWMFAHMWLGRNFGLHPHPPLLEKFCRFTLAPQPSSVLLTHLKEVSRDPDNYWCDEHAGMAVDACREMAPTVDVVVPEVGAGVRL